MKSISSKQNGRGDDMDGTEFAKHAASCEKALKRFVYYRLSNQADADDVLQEIMMTAYIKRNTLQKPEMFKPWILRIATNKCNDFYRKHFNRLEIPITNDAVLENALSKNQHGLTITQYVQETLALLSQKDAQVLRLFYVERLSQAEISHVLGIPVGTVKSRLFTAKQKFKRTYPHPPISKGEMKMTKLPDILPDYTIVQSSEAPFIVKWEELEGWFLIPKLGEKCTWAMYDWPERKRTDRCVMEVVGRAAVHGVEGVEIVAQDYDDRKPGSSPIPRIFVAQLTDTHCRYLAVTNHDDGIKKISTFLDETFLANWGQQSVDNCGNDIYPKPKGLITRDGSNIQVASNALDVVGRYTVTLSGKKYDCICVLYVEDEVHGVLTEQFIDSNGRTVLWRRFNRDDWNMKTYKQPWSEKLPDNEQFTVNGKIYVHWYDCITDYIL